MALVSDDPLHDPKNAESWIIFQTSPLGITFVHPETFHFLRVNPAFSKMIGYSEEELTHVTFHDNTHPEDRHIGPDDFISLAKGESSLLRLEKRYLHKLGAVVWVSVHGSAVHDSKGGVRYLLAMVEDVTARKQAEEERARSLESELVARAEAEKLLALSRTLAGELDLHKLVQHVTDVSTALSGAQFGAFFYNVINEQGESYTLYTLSGAPREAFAGFPMPRNTALFGPTFRGESSIRVDDVLKDPRYGQSPPHFGMPPGHLSVRSYLAVPVVSRSGEVLGGLFFGHSQTGIFTERHERIVSGIAGHAALAIDNARLFARAEAARESLRRSNADLKQFAYVSSHDLQEPLRTITSFSQLLLHRYRDRLEGDALEFIEHIVDGAHRMNDVIQDLLAYSRVASPDPVLTSVDTASLLDAVLAEISDLIEATSASVTHDDLPAVQGDPARLELLVRHLVCNAIQYRSSEPPRIHIGAHREGSEWVFCVKDNGIGIAPEYHDRIFGIFKRLHGKDKPGTGIGLAICRKVVEHHGGRIWVRSFEGEGAEFYFTLPA